MKRYAYAMILFAAISRGAVAAPPTQPATQPTGPTVVKLSLAPTPTTRPAMRHQLLPEVRDLEPGNAAPVYFVAIAVMQTEDEPLNAVSDLLDKPLAELRGNAAAATAVARFGGSLRYVEIAAGREYCRWDMPMRREGMHTLLPHLNGLRQLARVMAVRARLEIANGQHDKAIRSIRTGLAMAIHLNDQGVLVQNLVAAAIALQMLHQLEALIDQPGAPNLYWPLSNLPDPFVDLRTGMEFERAFVDFTFPRLAQARRGELPIEQWPGVWREVQATMRDAMKQEPGIDLLDAAAQAMQVGAALGRAKAAMIAEGTPAEQVDKLPASYVVAMYHLKQANIMLDETWKAWSLPYPQAAAELERVDQQIKAARTDEPANMFMAFLPAVHRARLTLARLDAHIAALRVVEAIRAHAAAHAGKLPASLDAIELPVPNNPMTGKPMAYRVEGDTAVLEALAPPGTQQHFGRRYEITMGK